MTRNKLNIKPNDWDFLFYEKERLKKHQDYLDNYYSRKLDNDVENLQTYNKDKDRDVFNAKLQDLRNFVDEYLQHDYEKDQIETIRGILDRLERILWNESEEMK